MEWWRSHLKCNSIFIAMGISHNKYSFHTKKESEKCTKCNLITVGERCEIADNRTSNLIKRRRKCIRKPIKRCSFSMRYGELTVNAIKMLANSWVEAGWRMKFYSFFFSSSFSSPLWSHRRDCYRIYEWVLVGCFEYSIARNLNSLSQF